MSLVSRPRIFPAHMRCVFTSTGVLSTDYCITSVIQSPHDVVFFIDFSLYSSIKSTIFIIFLSSICAPLLIHDRRYTHLIALYKALKKEDVDTVLLEVRTDIMTSTYNQRRRIPRIRD
uniref:Ovule protein n=1 Tax=Heterorhabditis bacteriophora TaxID=37862 RepID=A0A1I7WZD4_HETBA